jgi:hypothetical protein
MTFRLMGCALFLLALVTFKLPASSAPAEGEKPASPPKWEYKAITLEEPKCAQDRYITAALNAAGLEGWELVSYEHPLLPPPFPEQAEGTMLIKPAATGPGKLNNPQTVDSFTGTMELKMAPNKTRRPAHPQPPCRMLFKRQLKPMGKAQP